jgi:hypothetical protein
VSEEGCRGRVAAALQTSANLDPEMDGAVLIGYVAVAEWMAPNGSRWLSQIDGLASGDGAPTWTRQGWLHNALHEGDGFGRDDDDDEEEDDDT